MSQDHTPPTLAELADWIDGRLTELDAARVAARAEAAIAAGDAATRATVAWLRAFKSRTTGTLLAAPPDSARADVLSLFESRARGAMPGAEGRIQRLVARLARSAGAGTALAGARGAQMQAQRRQLTFECEAADIVLNTQTQAGAYRVSGQVLPLSAMAADGLAVQLVRDDIEVAAVRSDEYGEFTFASVAPGAYAIVIVAGELEIRVAPVDLS